MNEDSAHPPEALRKRTKGYAGKCIRFSGTLPRGEESMILRRQLLRSGTSVGAQYREGCRARSNAEFISKLEGALQELDESGYWVELLIETCPGGFPTGASFFKE